MILGCIADDLTGATDLALMLTRAGMRTVQVMGVPEPGTTYPGIDAVVVALKSRTNPVAEAIDWSLRSADVLLAAGAKQLFFKYCSTFDSTEQGNIGPVAEALLAKIGGDIALVCPAFPVNKRTVYLGNLFVGDLPLAESPMKDHPLTPMRDSNLVRVLARQTKLAVGLVAHPDVEAGPVTIKAAFDTLAKSGVRFAVVDAVLDRHLIDMGTAAADHKLITGGSGIAMGLPANFVRAGMMQPATAPTTMTAPTGRAAIIAGSCSEATRGQIAVAIRAGLPALRIDADKVANGEQRHADIVAWAVQQPPSNPVLIYSSATPGDIAKVQAAFGRERAGQMIEEVLATVAAALVTEGFARFIIAGGETSGAVVTKLGISQIEIGPEIDPGVPWTKSLGTKSLGTATAGTPAIVLALKSGNFGSPDFFTKAWSKLT
jgi:3-dehydrotetronate 4-kinase